MTPMPNYKRRYIPNEVFTIQGNIVWIKGINMLKLLIDITKYRDLH